MPNAPRPSSFDLARLRAGLHPFRLHYFPTLRSTNDHAGVLRKRGDLFAPAVVLTSAQTAGRGRGTNTWFSTPGSLTVTFVLRAGDALAPHHVPLAAGLAVRTAAAQLAENDSVQLKWPNDLVHAPAGQPAFRKLAGLLCERQDNVDMIGIGLNVNASRQSAIPKPLRDKVTCLQQMTTPPRPHDLTDVLIALAAQLHATLVRTAADTPFPALLREYDRHHALVGRRITVHATAEPPVTGRCEGLDDTGRLLVRAGSHLHRVIAGRIELA